MNTENNIQKENANPLYGLFDLIHLILKNKISFILFVLITLSINIYIYNINNKDIVIDTGIKYKFTAEVIAKSPLENVSIDLLIQQLNQMQTMISKEGTTFNAELLPTISIFNPEYLFIEFFDMLTNSNVIKQVLGELGLVDDKTDLDTLNGLISFYAYNIEKEIKFHASRATPLIINIGFTSGNYDKDKTFVETLIVAANNTVREVFIQNIDRVMDNFSVNSKYIIQQALDQTNKRKTLEQEKLENRELQLLKSHYRIALSLNIKEPKIVAGEGSTSSYLSPLFFQVGSNNLAPMIESVEKKIENTLLFQQTADKLSQDAATNKLISRVKFAEDNVNNLIKMVNLKNENEFFLIYFNYKSIQVDTNNNVDKVGIRIKSKEYFLYILISFLGIFCLISFLLLKENYKKYKLN